jgi:hypothetical protein
VHHRHLELIRHSSSPDRGESLGDLLASKWPVLR